MDIEDLEFFIRKGIFSHDELAKALLMPLEKFKEELTPDLEEKIDYWIVKNKLGLLENMFNLATECPDEHDGIRVTATKYLLAALHGLTEKNALDKASLDLKRQNTKFNQTLKAAQMSTQWDEDITEKFIKNLKKVEKVLK